MQQFRDHNCNHNKMPCATQGVREFWPVWVPCVTFADRVLRSNQHGTKYAIRCHHTLYTDMETCPWRSWWIGIFKPNGIGMYDYVWQYIVQGTKCSLFCRRHLKMHFLKSTFWFTVHIFFFKKEFTGVVVIHSFPKFVSEIILDREHFFSSS